MTQFPETTEKNMFGSLGFMVEGRLRFCVRDDNVMFKLGASRCDELVQSGMASKVVMGKRTMKDWVYIPNDVLLSYEEFETFVDEAMTFSGK